MAELDRRLAVVTARQHSLVSLADVIDAGGTRSDAHRRVTGGRWEAAAPGVFRLAGVPWTYDARVMAAALAAGPGAVASHLCAARLLGLGFSHAPPELSIPRGRTHRPGLVRVHQSTDLHRSAPQEVRGIPTTDPARTLRERGLQPALHHRVFDGDRLVAEIDLAFPELLVAFEIDGAVHLHPMVKRNDDARDHALRRLGWTVRRIWWEIPVRQPALYLGIVRDVLDDARVAHRHAS